MENKAPIIIEAKIATLILIVGLWTMLIATLSFAVFMIAKPKEEPRFSVGNYYAASGDNGFDPVQNLNIPGALPPLEQPIVKHRSSPKK